MFTFFDNSLSENAGGAAAALFGTTALLCGSFGIISCRTLQFPQKNTDAYISAGAWSYKTQNYALVGDTVWVIDTCRSYKYLDKDLGVPYDLDATSKAVMAFSIIAPILGSLAILASCNGKGMKPVGVLFLLAGISQGLTLMIQSSSLCSDNPVIQYLEAATNLASTFEDTCEWGSGFRAAISAVVFWLVAGFAAMAAQDRGSGDQ